KNKNAFIIGNESCGIKKKTESLADSIIKICTTGKTESLNAAVAAAIIMYEISKKTNFLSSTQN
ncbi:MAG: hypothetical protein LBH27_01225, partial [Endomicrobium sp.]|nr:hypothetical protein [Endomicrobium sp.]